MAILGWAGGVRIYGAALEGTARWIADRLWIDRARGFARMGDAATIEYGLLAVTIGLFLCAPSIPLRSRARNAAAVGLPVAFALGVLVPIMQLTIWFAEPNGGGTPVIDMVLALGWAAHMAVPLIVWSRWLVRERGMAERRTARRGAARHGATHRLGRPVRPPRVRTGTRWLDRA